jgi:hypothetical protein
MASVSFRVDTDPTNKVYLVFRVLSTDVFPNTGAWEFVLNSLFCKSLDNQLVAGAGFEAATFGYERKFAEIPNYPILHKSRELKEIISPATSAHVPLIHHLCQSVSNNL